MIFKFSRENLEKVLDKLNNECRIFRESKIELIENTAPCFLGAICGAIPNSSDYFLNYLDLEKNFGARFAEIYDFDRHFLVELDEEEARKLGIFYTVAGQLKKHDEKPSQEDEVNLLIKKQEPVSAFN